MVLGKLAELQERVTESQVSRIEAIMEANENNDLDVVIGNLSLSKNNLAASLGVSRTKIDSAIEQLTKDGIEEFQDIAKVGLRFALTPWHCHMISDKLGIKTWNDVHPEKEIIAISNLKGGTGKSTVTVSLASALANDLIERKRVIIIDLDPQGSDKAFSQPDMEKSFDILTAVDLMLADYEKEARNNAYWDFVDEVGGHSEVVKASCHPTQYPNLDILPAFPSDERFNDFAVTQFPENRMLATSLLYEKVIKHIIDDYDVVIIDTSPSMNPLVWSALEAANGLIIPLTPRKLDWMATGSYLVSLVSYLEQLPSGGKNLDWFKVLLTNVEEEHGRDAAMVAEIQNAVGAQDMFFKTIVRSSAFEAAARNYRTVLDIRPKDGLVSSNQLNSAKASLNSVTRELVAYLKALRSK
tara:strand:- start:1962 stop:3197 length:1236 start_codon:yes stop_codon:yes gene_type:complete